jgi:hypothetical protein
VSAAVVVLLSLCVLCSVPLLVLFVAAALPYMYAKMAAVWYLLMHEESDRQGNVIILS